MLKKNPTFFVVAISSLAVLLLSSVEAQFSGYPVLDKVPAPKAEWLGLVDLATAPKAPIKPNAEACPPVDHFCDWSCTNCINPNVDYDRCLGKQEWGISYDDGPSQYTPAILDHLKALNVKATFFVIGSRITENPDILKRTVAEGHQIGIHTWSHPALTTLTNEAIIGELKWTETIIKEVTGLTPKFMRPPFGDIDDRVRHIVTSLGYKAVIWDLDTNDWMTADTPPDFDERWILGNFTEWTKNTTILATSHISLEHDLYPLSAKDAIPALDLVKGAGFNIKQVASCVNAAPYLEYPGFPNDNTTTTPTTGIPTPTGAPTPITTTDISDPSTSASPSISTPSPYSSSSSPLSYSLLNIFIIAIISIIFTFLPF